MAGMEVDDLRRLGGRDFQGSNQALKALARLGALSPRPAFVSTLEIYCWPQTSVHANFLKGLNCVFWGGA